MVGRPLVIALLLASCASRHPAPPAQILAIGDSILAQHRERGRSIPDVVAERTGLAVTNVAVSGAWATPGGGVLGIPDQRVDGRWAWLLLNGGANDLNGRCGCGDCDAVMDELVTRDTRSGALVRLVEQAVAAGTKVVFLGYARFPAGARYGFDRCDDELAEHRTRVAALAERVDGMWFVDATEVANDASDFLADRVHPSVGSSRAMGELVARTITERR